jgi:hypothetical protein
MKRMGFLSDDSESSARSHIISASELLVREGAEITKGMNFRDVKGTLSVMLVLPHNGQYTDRWDDGRKLLICEGHDSVAEGARGRIDDQLLLYASGKPTENGKFYKAAQAYKDGLRNVPLQVQVYEKLDPGVFFDKGIFTLVDASYGEQSRSDGTRKVAQFYLSPADVMAPETSWDERMISASEKALAWAKASGRCVICGSESGLHFRPGPEGTISLRCALHENPIEGNASMRLSLL